MKKIISSSVLLISLLLACTAQIHISGEGVNENTSPPAQGTTWLHDTTKDVLFYSPDYDKWISTAFDINMTRNAATSHTGALKFGAQIVDTTTGSELGYYAQGRLRIIAVSHQSDGGDAPNGSTYVFADQDTLMKVFWNDLTHSDVDPVADSSTAWVSTSERVIIPAGSIVSVFLKANSTSADNPDNPVVQLRCVREEDP